MCVYTENWKYLPNSKQDQAKMREGEEIARAETTSDDMICEHMSPEMSARLKIVQKLLVVGTGLSTSTLSLLFPFMCWPWTARPALHKSLSSPFWLNLVVKTDVKTLTSSWRGRRCRQDLLKNALVPKPLSFQGMTFDPRGAHRTTHGLSIMFVVYGGSNAGCRVAPSEC